MEKGTFGAGCFWGVESAFRKLPGVLDAACGYAGGHTENPTYEQVCRKDTNHAEVVEVLFDPAVLPYEELLKAFWNMHNPTQLNRQGPDVGTQYRSVIFCHSDAQLAAAQASKEEVQKHIFKPVVTQILPAPKFYRAEEYHQQYFARRGIDPTCHI